MSGRGPLNWRFALHVLMAVSILAAVGILAASVAAVPPRPEQPRPDIFPGGPTGNLQDLNPLTILSKQERSSTYRLLTMPGCVAGSIPVDLELATVDLASTTKYDLSRDDQDYDFTVRINCGSEQIRICGSVSVFCLGRGFPFNPDVEISDILSWWQPDTRLAILLHEIAGHAISTWNEQYALCGSSCGFLSSPNWVDFMNTGPLSRHGFGDIERERWDRTMYSLQVVVTPTPEPATPTPTATLAPPTATATPTMTPSAPTITPAPSETPTTEPTAIFVSPTPTPDEGPDESGGGDLGLITAGIVIFFAIVLAVLLRKK